MLNRKYPSHWQALLLTICLTVAQPVLADALRDFSGKPHNLNEYTGKGKWLVIMFWASDCHVCNQEAHQYVDFHFAYSDTMASLLGVSLDGKARQKEAEGFVSRHKLNFPNLIGEPEDVAGLFTALTGADWVGTPTFLIYNPAGKLVAQQAGAVPAELITEFIKSQSAASSKKPG